MREALGKKTGYIAHVSVSNENKQTFQKNKQTNKQAHMLGHQTVSTYRPCYLLGMTGIQTTQPATELNCLSRLQLVRVHVRHTVQI